MVTIQNPIYKMLEQNPWLLMALIAGSLRRSFTIDKFLDTDTQFDFSDDDCEVTNETNK